MLRLTTNLLQTFTTAACKQKIFLIYGAVGVGKATYAKLLSKDLGYRHFSIDR